MEDELWKRVAITKKTVGDELELEGTLQINVLSGILTTLFCEYLIDIPCGNFFELLFATKFCYQSVLSDILFFFFSGFFFQV